MKPRASLICAAVLALSVSCGSDPNNHGFFDEGPGEDNGGLEDTTGVDLVGVDTAGRDTTVVESGCLPAAGTPGNATVTAGAAQTFATVETTAMNQMDNMSSPLPYIRMGALALGTGECATAGLLYLASDPESGSMKKLMYQDVTTVGLRAATPEPELVIDAISPATHNLTLFYAAACMPIAMRPTSTGYMQFERSAEACGKGQTVALDLDGTVSAVTGMGGWQERDGTMVVIARANLDGTPTGIIGRRTIKPSSSWEFETFDMPATYTDLYSLRVAADGTVHALYTKTQYPCDGDCDLDLYYGRKADGGSWVEETVQESKWAGVDNATQDEYSADPTMVVDSRGEPVVAANFLTRAVTGSIKSSELRVYGRDNGEWCRETVATVVDEYQGKDGSDMTGAMPFVTLDGVGRIHVVFQDMAQWHDSNNYANAVNGQIRYAVRAGKKWTLKTLVTQEGEGTGAAAAPLYGMLPTTLAVSDDGQTVYAAGASFEWDTNSIYLSDYVPITFNATVVRADVDLP